MSKIQFQYVCCIICLLFVGVITFNTESEPENILEPITVSAQYKSVDELPPVIDQHELECLAVNIYHEARGETQKGKLAVAHVTVNRVKSKRFPNTVCDVVYQAQYSEWWLARGKQVPVRHRCHFSWYCDGKSDKIVLTDSRGRIIQKNMKAWQSSNLIAKQVLLNKTQDPTRGATHYYNPRLAWFLRLYL